MDGGIGRRVRANLLDHRDVPGHVPREDALHDVAELGGHPTTQDVSWGKSHDMVRWPDVFDPGVANLYIRESRRISNSRFHNALKMIQ